ncbi:hypothetical protein [Bartonella alsatica]|uniref:hypothetical protein n=1 Tax=Bartonella alsatica TaxID=52764 RepID=UPI000301DBCF
MHKEFKEQSSEHFSDKTIGEIIKTLAKRHGYQAKISQQFIEQTLFYVVCTDH